MPAWWRLTVALLLSLACTSHSTRKIAVVLSGGFSPINGKFKGTDINSKSPKVASFVEKTNATLKFVRLTANSIKKHLVAPNDADVFLWSWNPPLAAGFKAAYGDRLVRSAFVENDEVTFKRVGACVQNDLHCVHSLSWAYALREAVGLVSEEERARGVRYGAVVFGRPDVVYFQDVRASAIDTSRVVGMPTAAVGKNCGDFHYVMSRSAAQVFGGLYDEATDPTSKFRISDRQCFKGKYLVSKHLEIDDTSTGRQPHNEGIYRDFAFANCHIFPTGNASAELASLGFSMDHLKLLYEARFHARGNHVGDWDLCPTFAENVPELADAWVKQQAALKGTSPSKRPPAATAGAPARVAPKPVSQWLSLTARTIQRLNQRPERASKKGAKQVTKPNRLARASEAW